jgi:hypothetical protein
MIPTFGHTTLGAGAFENTHAELNEPALDRIFGEYVISSTERSAAVYVN